MTDGGDTFAGLRRRLLELDERVRELEARHERDELEASRLRAWLKRIAAAARGRNWNAAIAALFSPRWPDGVKPRAVSPPLGSEEESNG